MSVWANHLARKEKPCHAKPMESQHLSDVLLLAFTYPELPVSVQGDLENSRSDSRLQEVPNLESARKAILENSF